jgi:uncharacterized protein YcbK (DUF882 family)
VREGTDVGDLSPHFSSSEFVDRRTGDCPLPCRRLLEVLEEVRRAGGRPVTIVSGYRSQKTNREVGGARASRHLFGDAADIPAGIVTVAQALEAGAIGVGARNGFAVHLDVRPGRPVVWHY